MVVGIDPSHNASNATLVRECSPFAGCRWGVACSIPVGMHEDDRSNSEIGGVMEGKSRVLILCANNPHDSPLHAFISEVFFSHK